MLPPWMLKLATKKLLQPESRRKLLVLIVIIIGSIFLLPALVLLPLSIFTGDDLTADFDITKSAVYQEIYPVYQDYISDLTNLLNEKAKEVKEENKEWIEGDEDEEGHWKYPSVTVMEPKPPLAALLAYLCQENENVLNAKKYEADQEEITVFFDSIYQMKVTGGDMRFTVETQFLTDKEIAELYYPDDKAKQGLYLQSIELINQFLSAAENAEIEGELNISSEARDVLMQIYNALIDSGYSEAAASGACGNIQQECNFNYTMGPPAYGIVQWTAGRFRNLENYVASHGFSSWKVLDGQIQFMLHELEGSYKNRLDRYASLYAGATSYKKIEDARLAAFVFCAVYEACEYNPDKGWGSAQGSIAGPDGKRWQQLEYRQNYAEAIYNALNGSSSSLGSIANGSSSEKLAALFPNGLPNTSSQAGKYMEKIPIEVWDGTKKTTKYVTLHKALKPDIQEIFSDIADAHITLKSVSGYSWREMNNGGSGSRSHHSYGVALDIDPDYNPSGKYSGNPEGIKPDLFCYYYTHPWAPKTNESSISPSGVIVRAFESRGWVWGAKWGTVMAPTREPYDPGYHDFMHFSFTGH